MQICRPPLPSKCRPLKDLDSTSKGGAFVIPGTKTTLHVGGFIDLSTSYDTGSSIGPAGYIVEGFNAANTKSNVNNLGASGTNTGSTAATYGTGKIALPGTPAAKEVGRFQMDPRFSRLNIETDTPSEFGDIGTVLEFVGVGNSDFLAGGDMSYQWGSAAHTPAYEKGHRSKWSS